MNLELKKMHMLQLTDAEAAMPDPAAAAMYESLCAACEKRPEGLTDQDQMLIADIAAMEKLKQQLYADIRQRGVVEDFRNGRQRIKRENKSIATARMLMEQQRKHLAELRLTPNSRKAVQITLDDDFDSF